MEELPNCFPLLRNIIFCIQHIRVSSMCNWAGFLLESGLYAKILLTGSWESKDTCKSIFLVLLQTQKPLLLSVNGILGRGAFSVSVKTSVSLHCSSAEEHRGNQEGSMLWWQSGHGGSSFQYWQQQQLLLPFWKTRFVTAAANYTENLLS